MTDQGPQSALAVSSSRMVGATPGSWVSQAASTGLVADHVAHPPAGGRLRRDRAAALATTGGRH
jgi:hypothetical protein